ncbi:cysteine desulfurase [Saccharopolyspora lacisalsi]|uniref:Cysteine desulfurase n=1 Tax=Halosaccharopolyspora lacisalsi TaxID=1000566 RepID=A0A839DW45_9PSEU|nr:cysteine desulfurase family protein [Halosaccharopolyspora lacisalsi]MBA8825253.1 cysteine desulfurase [Halosaccharopolyspora lacisalsi]
MTYLDHAATTPMRPEAVAVMSEALTRSGNASSLHTSGRRARRAVEESREGIAAALGARPSEVLFTAGGTESDNLAVKGIFWARRAADPKRRRILASAVEHHAVLDAVEWLVEHEGAEVTWLEVDAHGRVLPEVLERAIVAAPDEVALATVMWANNEVGTVNPVADLAAVTASHGVPLHTDAVQAIETLPVDFGTSGAAALTMTGHKIGGPYGIGVLVLARDVECTPVLHGGGQEREVRSGTLDTPAVLGLASAVREAVDARADHVGELARLRDELITGVRDAVPDAVLNGDPDEPTADGPGRLAGNAHFTFPGCEGDSLLMLLDAQGIECSTGSACTAGVAEPSHVLLAMGAEPTAARGSLRFSLGHDSTPADVQALTAAIGPAVRRARSAGLTGLRKNPVDPVTTTPTEV